MNRTKKFFFTVINDLSYDQRMIRICSSLAHNGYNVVLIGRKLPDSIPLAEMPFKQLRLSCFSRKGFFLYAEFNLRLFFFLLFKKADLVCAIDLDTIIPCCLVSKIKNIPRVYDAHELFCEMKEIVSRPAVYRFWKRIERWSVPQFKWGYTVNDLIVAEFKKMYNADYEVIRNMPLLSPLIIPEKSNRYVIYQGAVNEGRSFETLIPAMKNVAAKLVICGDGNFMQQAMQLASDHYLRDKIIFTGKQTPSALKTYTLNAYIGVTLFDDLGLSNYYSLANRFFDYMHAGIPQVCVNYPLYRAIVRQHEFALLIDDISAENLAFQLNRLLEDEHLYKHLQNNCIAARTILNWSEEEKRLISFYNKIFGTIG